VTAVLAVRLPRDRFDDLLRRGSMAAYKLAASAAELLAARLQATDRWIEDMRQQRQDAEIAASWRAFRHRAASYGIASFFSVGTFTPGGV
jgi:CRP-like cAMP-binding protein